jgi:hypothetical protein
MFESMYRFLYSLTTLPRIHLEDHRNYAKAILLSLRMFRIDLIERLLVKHSIHHEEQSHRGNENTVTRNRMAFSSKNAYHRKEIQENNIVCGLCIYQVPNSLQSIIAYEI